MVRICDILLSSMALVLILPVILPVILILRLTGEGEIFYVQQRVGRNEKMFSLLKFATMLKNSPNIGTGTITTRNDPRVLPVGRILRKTKINELPQLINILVGDMSVIGPRPVTKAHYDHYPEHLRKRLSTVRPGLSGVGSIIFRDEERLLSNKKNPTHYYEFEIAPYKALLESWFVENQGLGLYFKCILVTIIVVLFPSSRIIYKVMSGIPAPDGILRDDLMDDPHR